jgi:hypothetical protein
MVVGPDGKVDFPEPPVYSLPLGLGMPQERPPVPFSVSFRPGDQLLLYTDGVTEARDGSGMFYPLGLRAWLLASADPQIALEALRTDLIRHAGGPLHDDAAMLLLRHRQSAIQALGTGDEDEDQAAEDAETGAVADAGTGKAAATATAATAEEAS